MWLGHQSCIFGVALQIYGSVTAAGNDLPRLRTRVVERKFSQLGSQTTAAQGVRHASMGDGHHVLLKPIVKHATLRINDQKKAVIRCIMLHGWGCSSVHFEIPIINTAHTVSIAIMPIKHPAQRPTIGHFTLVGISCGSTCFKSSLALPAIQVLDFGNAMRKK